VTAAGWLAYGHPAWMVVSLGLCLFALRIGLAIRRARLAHRPPPRGARARHLSLAKSGVTLVLLGAALGPLTVAMLRDWTPMSSFHALVGGIAAVLFAGAALQGRRLERGDRAARNAHALLGGAAISIALAAAIAGFALLP
jgi:phosphate/sulfate permease